MAASNPPEPPPRADPALLDGLDLPWEADAPLAPHTWYGVGGPADLLAHPQSVNQLAELMRRCREADVALHVLGSGANLLVADPGVRGVVVRLDAPAFSAVERTNDHVAAGAGADLARLILTCAKMGLAGLEALAGIPASIGGALRMNCGGRYGDIGSVTQSVEVMDDAGRVRTLLRDDLRFGYRQSGIGEPIILGGSFALQPDDPVKLRDRVKEIFAYKKSTQPLADQSAGCAFKNPPKDVCEKSAGQLIDEADLKGFTVGGAQVSVRHANFIVVQQACRADDVLNLIRTVRRKVRDHHGVDLVPEVVVWGEAIDLDPEAG